MRGTVTDDGHYLIITVWQGTDPKNRVYYKDLSKPDARSSSCSMISTPSTISSIMMVPSSGSRPISTRRAAASSPSTPASPSAQLEDDHSRGHRKLEHANVVNNNFVLYLYLKDAHTEGRIYDLQGKSLHNVDLPGIGTAAGLGASARIKRRFIPSPVSPPRPRSIATTDHRQEHGVFRQPKVDFDPSRYETKQVFYTSKDGTQVFRCSSRIKKE